MGTINKMKELLYYEKGISAKCFIKINDEWGMAFGERERIIHLASDPPPKRTPKFKPAKGWNIFNGFNIHEIEYAKPLENNFIRDNNIIQFILDNELLESIVKVIFEHYPFKD